MSVLDANNTSDALVSTVSELLLGESPEKRARAARDLGRTQTKTAVIYLIQALRDQSEEVLVAAAESLAESGDPSGIAPLKKLQDDNRLSDQGRSVISAAIASLERSTSQSSSATQYRPRLLENSYQEIHRTMRDSTLGSSSVMPDQEKDPIPPASLLAQTPALDKSHEERQHLEAAFFKAVQRANSL